MFADLAAVGNYPVEPRLVAIANGSGAITAGGRTGNGGAPIVPGTQIVDWGVQHHPRHRCNRECVGCAGHGATETDFGSGCRYFLFFGDSLNVHAEGRCLMTTRRAVSADTAANVRVRSDI